MAERVLSQLRPLLPAVRHNEATDEQRRLFATQLITLPAFRDKTATLFFSNFVGDCFADFEDLQDASVDAVLDLCEDEDEATRILGIQGLGKTAKADIRWVRGNAGVLLQLLECPEKELEVVKKTLAGLLNLSPTQVLGVMADDCKSSEDETGASRRNILEYLYKDCVEFRRQNMDKPAVALVFHKGFMEVLGLLGAGAHVERLMLLEMLIKLPSISGDGVKAETTGAFIRGLLADSRPKSKPDRMRYVQLFNTMATRAVLDPLVGLEFFSKHGSTVVGGILDDEDRGGVCIGLVKRLEDWAQAAVKQWEAGGQSEDEGKLVRRSAEQVIDELLDWADVRSDETVKRCASQIEQILLPIYQLVRCRDRRGSSIREPEKLLAFGARANKCSNAFSRHSTEARSLTNVSSMATILGKRSAPFEGITPSWLPEPPSSLRKPIPPSAPGRSIPTPVPSAPSAQRLPTGPRGAPIPNERAPASHLRSGLPTAPAGARTGTPSHSPALTPSISSLSINGRANVKGRADAIDLTNDDKPSSSRGRELLSSTSTPPAAAPASYRGHELPLKPPSQSEPVEESMDPAPPSSSGSAPSLLSRIQKRQRDDPLHAPSPSTTPSLTPSSLRNRISGGRGGKADEPELKRIKSEDNVLPPKSRLLGRMSRGGNGDSPKPDDSARGSPGSSSASTALADRFNRNGLPPPSTLTFKRTPSHSTKAPSPPPKPAAPPLPLSIRGAHVPEPEEHFVRRGRGFEGDEDVPMTGVVEKKAIPPVAPVAQPHPRPAAAAVAKPPRSLFAAAKESISSTKAKIVRNAERRPVPSSQTNGAAARSGGAVPAETTLIGRMAPLHSGR